MKNEKYSKPIQNIILDTCILQYSNKKNIQNELSEYLQDLIERKFDLYISEISIAELLTNLTRENEDEGAKTISYFKKYTVEQNTLIASAQLSSIYNKVGINNLDISKVDGGHINLSDKIIGATAILNGALILTANIQDFPNPYFIPVEEHLLIYRNKHGKSMLYLQLLSPNIMLINKVFNRRK